MLDDLEERLGPEGFLFGDRMTEADIQLFVTLIRFDAAYHGRVRMRPAAHRRLPAAARAPGPGAGDPGIAETVSIAHIKAGYYGLRAINPTGIVPLGPPLDLPHLAA